MKSVVQKTKKTDRMLNLFLLFMVYQFVLHLYYTLSAKDPRLIAPAFVAFIHDIAILGIITAFGHLIILVLPERFKNFTKHFFSVAIILCGVSLSFYPKMLREYLVFPVNIFDSDISSAKTLISDYLGFSSLLPAIIALILGLLVYRLNKGLKIPNWIKTMGLVLIILILGFTLKRPSPQPFIYSLQKKVESITGGKQRAVSSLERKNTKLTTSKKLNLLKYSSNEISSYNHILLVVLEGVTADTFENGFLTIPNGFYEQNKNNAVYYNNYYTSNLDSYTSLIAMLTSVQVPYRAYADASLYEKVNTAPSITQDLQSRDFNNVFISCYEYQPFIPTQKYWDKIYERNDLPPNDEWLSLGSSKMESATEDKAAISTIVKSIKSNEKSFILHELVYGHSPEWRATTGKTQNVYHNEYLLELSDELKRENLFDRTLFIIVSDHGNRAKSTEIENYRIPLLIIGDNIDSTLKRDEFLTHLDLPNIIYHYIASEKHPDSKNETFFVGSTEKWVYGKMKRNKENLFIDNATGIILFEEGNLNAIEVRNEFQDYLNAFNVKYGR